MTRNRLQHFRRKILDPIAWRVSRRALHRVMTGCDIESILQSTDRFVGRGFYSRIRPAQRFNEIRELARIVQQRAPRVIVEIGTHRGGTLFIWARSNPQASLIVSIDLPNGRFGGGYECRRMRFYREFVHDRPETQLELWRCSSHDQSTLRKLNAVLAGRKIDFLFLDGDHTYDGVMQDYEMYSPLVTPGGLIAFHDINHEQEGHAVDRAWNELKTRHRFDEYIDDRSRRHMGIGVLYL